MIGNYVITSCLVNKHICTIIVEQTENGMTIAVACMSKQRKDSMRICHSPWSLIAVGHNLCG